MTHDSKWLQFRELRFRACQLNGYKPEYGSRWDSASMAFYLSGYSEPVVVDANSTEVQEWARRLDRIVKEMVG